MTFCEDESKGREQEARIWGRGVTVSSSPNQRPHDSLLLHNIITGLQQSANDTQTVLINDLLQGMRDNEKEL